MKVTLVFALFSLLWSGTPIHAQSLCVKCLNAAQIELKKCLECCH